MHVFNPSIWHAEASGSMWVWGWLVYIMSSRTTRVTWWDPVSKNKTNYIYCVCVCTPQYMFGGQRTTWVYFSLWLLGIKLRLSGLAVSACIHWAILFSLSNNKQTKKTNYLLCVFCMLVWWGQRTTLCSCGVGFLFQLYVGLWDLIQVTKLDSRHAPLPIYSPCWLSPLYNLTIYYTCHVFVVVVSLIAYIFKKLFYFLMCQCCNMCTGDLGGQRRVWESPRAGVSQFCFPLSELVAILWSFRRAAKIPNCWAIASTPILAYVLIA